MSELGQNRKYSLRADVFRSCTDNGHRVGAGEFVPAAFVMWQRRRDSRTSVDKNMLEAIDEKPRVNERLGFSWSLKRGLLRPVSRPGIQFINSTSFRSVCAVAGCAQRTSREYLVLARITVAVRLHSATG
jgi:hypothetical protein